MLRVSRALHQQVTAHCQRQSPKEACGILAGHRMPQPGQAGDVVAVYPMTNVEDSAIGYAMDPKEQLALERTMRDRSQRLLGIYHSHTATEAYPSSVDVSLAISPDLSYVLVSLKDRNTPDFKSYRIDGMTIVPEAVVIDDASVGVRRGGSG